MLFLKKTVSFISCITHWNKENIIISETCHKCLVYSLCKVSSLVIGCSCYLSFSCPSGLGRSLWIHGLCSWAWPALHCGLWKDQLLRVAPRPLSGHSSPPGRPSKEGSWKDKESQIRLTFIPLISLYEMTESTFYIGYFRLSGFYRVFQCNPGLHAQTHKPLKHQNAWNVVWRASHVYKVRFARSRQSFWHAPRLHINICGDNAPHKNSGHKRLDCVVLNIHNRNWLRAALWDK